MNRGVKKIDFGNYKKPEESLVVKVLTLAGFKFTGVFNKKHLDCPLAVIQGKFRALEALPDRLFHAELGWKQLGLNTALGLVDVGELDPVVQWLRPPMAGDKELEEIFQFSLLAVPVDVTKAMAAKK